MKITNDIKIFIVEDDKVQAEILLNKLLGYNNDYNITKYSNGKDLIANFKNNYPNSKYVYLILDYFLQSSDSTENLNAIDIIKQLNKEFPQVRIIIFSAYENDGDAKFTELIKEPNIIEFVKKSIHAFSQIQNILRFDYAQTCLYRKKRRFTWAMSFFAAALTVSIVYLLFNSFG